MQGRLVPPEGGRFQSFPRDRWRDEFPIAAAAGLETIEWIYDAYGEDMNPLATDRGVSDMRHLCAVHRIGVESVCADWFMDFPLIGIGGEQRQARWNRLVWLMERCSRIGVNRVVIPFVDSSAIRTSEDLEAVAAGINSVSNAIDRCDVEIHLETALSPADFAGLLACLSHPRVMVNYDSGNSASLGYRPGEEFAAYGNRVGSVHLKDRNLGGGTVPLGSGDTDFEGLFEALKQVGYAGDFILQAARGDSGDELRWAGQNASAARQMIKRLEAG